MEQYFSEEIARFIKEITQELSERNNEDQQEVIIEIIQRYTGLPKEQAEEFLKRMISGINTFEEIVASKDFSETKAKLSPEVLKDTEDQIKLQVDATLEEVSQYVKEENDANGTGTQMEQEQEQEQDKIVDLIHALAYQRANSAGLLGDTAKTPEEIGVIGAASAHTSRIISDFASGEITVEEAKEDLRNTFDSTVESLIRKGYDLLHAGIVKTTRAYFGPVVSTIAHVGLSLVKEKVVKVVKNIASGIWNTVKGFFTKLFS